MESCPTRPQHGRPAHIKAIPSLDFPVASYINSLFSAQSDPDPADDPVSTFIRPLLESESVHPVAQDEIDRICDELAKQWQQLTGTEEAVQQKGPAKLDVALDMRRQEMKSKRQAVTQVVDIASVVKARESQVNMKALEKAEAKLKAKLEKRQQKSLYEGSKLIEAHNNKKSYEELFLEVNPLTAIGQGKGKSKDIHLENIDVNFGSNRILSNATLTLPHGRRVGLIGRNGIGKSTLLRAMALPEVPIPPHISILYVQQEVVGDDTPAIESVLQADVHRSRLLAEEKELNVQLEALEKESEELAASGAGASEEEQEKKHAELRKLERKKDDATGRLGEVQRLLVEIDAETGPARAGEFLAGLGFEKQDQDMPTRAFSGGWRMRLSRARALFCKPDLLLLDEPSNNLDLNALAWLEDYLQTWPATLLVVSHDRAFLNAVATDIMHQHNEPSPLPANITFGSPPSPFAFKGACI
ncbi:hypothetical protein JCM10213v2_004132 [Rhodosporidiobolus nylandii]